MPPKKKRKLATLASHGSATGLEAILDLVKEEGIPDASSRRTTSRAIEADLNIDTPHGKVVQHLPLPMREGADYSWPACHPGAMLTYLCTFALEFQVFLSNLLTSKPPTPEEPWQFAMYADEVVPGDLLATDNTRKSMILYWTFLQFGTLMSRDHCWFYLGSIRSKVLKKVRAGLSGLARVILNTWFFSEQFNVSRHGWLVHGCDGNVMGPVFVNTGFIIADEDARRAFWRVKGSSGNALCMWCKNVRRLGSELAEYSEYLIDHTSTNFDAFDLHDDASIYDACERLSRMPPGELAAEETNLGIAYEPYGLLFCQALRAYVLPISHTMIDFGHTWVTNGVFHFELTNFLDAARVAPTSLRYRHIHDFFQGWRWPSREKHPPRDVFHQERYTHGSGFSAGSSECMSLYPVLRLFAKTQIGATALVLEKQSLFAMFLVLDGWYAFTYGLMDEDGVVDWRDQFLDHLEKYKRAYGHIANCVKPKHHETLHFFHMVRRFGLLFPTFVCERKHRFWKEIANTIKTTSSFDRQVLVAYLNKQAVLLQNEELFRTSDFLRTPEQAIHSEYLPAPGSWHASHSMYMNSTLYTVGDMVLLDFERVLCVASLETCLRLDREDRQHFAIVRRYTRIYEDQWRAQATQLVSASSLKGPCIWKPLPNNDRIVLIPPQYEWHRGLDAHFA